MYLLSQKKFYDNLLTKACQIFPNTTKIT